MAKRIRSTHDYITMVRRMVAATGRRVAQGDPEDLAELVALQSALDQAILDAVAGQRADGITWQSIGQATGTTKQAAIMKWGRHLQG